jgi:hypothetical protein
VARCSYARRWLQTHSDVAGGSRSRRSVRFAVDSAEAIERDADVYSPAPVGERAAREVRGCESPMDKLERGLSPPIGGTLPPSPTVEGHAGR